MEPDEADEEPLDFGADAGADDAGLTGEPSEYTSAADVSGAGAVFVGFGAGAGAGVDAAGVVAGSEAVCVLEAGAEPAEPAPGSAA